MPADLLPVDVAMDAEEQAAMDAIAAAYGMILGMGLSDNRGELVGAVHVLQSFVAQHLLHRISPKSWNDWFRHQGSRPPNSSAPPSVASKERPDVR